MTYEQKIEVDELAFISNIFASDHVSKKVGKLDSTELLWKKSEELCLVKFLPNNYFF